jgi:hypothetical protein
MEAHAATLALLTKDLSFADPDKLERAIGKWVVTERFMPRAAELVSLMQAECREVSPQQLAEEANARLVADPNGRRDIHWVVDGDNIRLEIKPR